MKTHQPFHEWLYLKADWRVSSGLMAGRRYTFDAFPCQRFIVADPSEQQVVMKSSQMAISEIYTLARPFWAMDVLKANWGILFPSQQAMRHFYRTRIKGALAKNAYVRGYTIGENEGNVDSFARHLYLRYTTTEMAIATFDADGVTVDEADYHEQDSLYGAKVSRTQGAMRDTYWYEVSTPSYPNFGVHLAFLNSSQQVWLIKCGACNHENDLTTRIGDYDMSDVGGFFEEYLADERIPDWRDYHIPCTGCGRPLDPTNPLVPAKSSMGGGRWVARYPKRAVSGYHLQVFQRLYDEGTPQVLRRVRESYLKATQPQHLRRWWNFVLGMPFLAREGRLTDNDILAVSDSSLNDEWIRDVAYSTYFHTRHVQGDWMGVDVRLGQYHVVEMRRGVGESMTLAGVGWVTSATEVRDLWERRGRPVFVIDAAPDTNETRALVRAMGKKAFRASFSRGTMQMWQQSADPDHLIVNRPLVMEATKALVESRNLTVPTAAWAVGAGVMRTVGEQSTEETLKDHFKAPVMIRSYSESSTNEIYDFPKSAMGGIDPHYFMAATLAYLGTQLRAAPAIAIIVPR